MKLPRINIIFKEAANSLVKRSERGIVALVLKEDLATKGLKETYVLKSITETPKKMETVVEDEKTIEKASEKFSEYNMEQIKLAFMGTVKPPKKVIIYVADTNGADVESDSFYDKAMNYLESVKFDYLAVPGVKFLQTDKLPIWVKGLRAKNVRVKAVLAHCEANTEGIINFATDDIKVAGKDQSGNDIVKEYPAEDYCSRIAGMLAGLPLSMSATYQVLPEVMDVPHFSKEHFDGEIGKGKFLLINDGEKVKVTRGINSLVTPALHQGESFKKIKIVDTMDMIDSDIRNLAEENYIGKMPNIYDNKCLLIVAIKVYFKQLENDMILDKGKNTVGIDMVNQRLFLEGTGVDVDSMDEQAIKVANTKDEVFLTSSIKIVDAMENITFNVNM